MGRFGIVVDCCGSLWLVVARCGLLWLVVGHCGWLWVVPDFSVYESLVLKQFKLAGL